MADDDEGQEAPAAEPEPKPKPLFGGKQAPLFKKKPKAAAKFLSDHKLAVISVLLAIVGLVLVLRNRSSSTSGSTSANVSGQSAPADNAADDATSDPSDMQPWWTGTDAGGGGGGLSAPAPPTSSGTPKAKHPATKSAAKPQPGSHPKSSAAEPGPASVAAPRTDNRAATLAGLYAPLEPSSSPVHSVAATAHPASHVAVGTSRNGSNVLVPFTVRAGHPPPQGMGTHMAAAAKRPAGARVTGHK